MNLATALTVTAVVLFVLAALGISGLPLIAIGLACFAAGHLPWPL